MVACFRGAMFVLRGCHGAVPQGPKSVVVFWDTGGMCRHGHH